MSVTLSLSYADCVYIDDSILEIIPYQGIEINMHHVKELQTQLAKHQRPTNLLLSRTHGFSFKFNVLPALLNIPYVMAIAFHAKNQSSYIITEMDLRLTLSQNKPVEVFTEKLIAILWLNTKKLSGSDAQPIIPQRLGLDAVNHLIASERTVESMKAIPGKNLLKESTLSCD